MLTPLQEAQQAFGKGVMLANRLSEDDKDTFIAWAQVQLLSRGMAVTVTTRRAPKLPTVDEIFAEPHCCGASGFNPMLGDNCPACERNR